MPFKQIMYEQRMYVRNLCNREFVKFAHLIATEKRANIF